MLGSQSKLFYGPHLPVGGPAKTFYRKPGGSLGAEPVQRAAQQPEHQQHRENLPYRFHS
jgi:hypothetical protein